MSNLHRQTVRKQKHREMVGGLSLLSEESYSEPSLQELIQQEQALGEVEQVGQVEQVGIADDLLIEEHELFKRLVFPIVETYSNLDNSSSFNTYYRPPKSGPILIFIHGAGSSAMTFGKLAQELVKLDDSLGIFTYTLRGHDEISQDTDYSLQAFVDDFAFVLNRFISTHDISSSIYLIGHSLGGAILSKFVQSNDVNSFNIKGIAMLDIVEETAIHALGAMPLFISKRPKKFQSLNDAIAWHMGFLLHNEESAKISVPDLFNDDLTWKMDLQLTQPFWDTWFADLSKNFLAFSGPKLLVLSTHETLDKQLIIGQMQGKYQLVVFNNNSKAGHFIQEDLPSQLSICLLDFLKRNESPAKFMEQELGITPTWGGKINK